MAVASTVRSRSKEPDQLCADAVDLAREALTTPDDSVPGNGGLGGAARVRPEVVGEHLEAVAVSDRVVTHFFACLDRAYIGWHWAVTVARAPRSKVITVDESELLPGPDALLAPAWVPWQDRLRPGDVGIGDLLPASADDERLVPFTTLDGDDAVTDWVSPHADSEDQTPGRPSRRNCPRPAGSGCCRPTAAMIRPIAGTKAITARGPRCLTLRPRIA